MTKILFIVTQSEMGGAQRYVFEVVSHLDQKKYEILVAAGEGDGELFRKISKLKTQNSKLNLKIQKLKYLKRKPLPWEIVLAIREIYNLLKKEKPDIIFLCSTTAGLLGSIAVKLIRNSQHSHKNSPRSRAELATGQPRSELRSTSGAYHSHYIIYRIGGWAFRDPRNFVLNKILLWAEKMTAPLKDKIIVNSEEDLKLALKYKICPAEKIVKIYNGIDIKSLNFLARKEAREYLNSKCKMQNAKLQFKIQNYKIIGCVANFYKTKGLPYLIEAAHILNSELGIKNYGIFIIGEGKGREKLENLIKKYNLENNVFLLGKIPDAYRYLKAFDIFVLPSLKEGFPWIILEAMAAEIPIIATKTGAIPEIIENGVDGLLVEPKNDQQLAEKIFFLMKNPERAKEIAIKAREKLKEFSLEKMIIETKKVLFP
jgi:glycosyltransferase involved in cell wall biosynthesis